MPHVVNGIGTWYWGKRNAVGRQGLCEHCGAAGTLQSYDTTLFFVVLMLPIIPLRKYHVSHECPRCKRHRVIKLSEWETKRRETVMQAVQACQAAPRDEAKAVEAIELAGSFEHIQALESLATFVEREQPRSAKAHQALGMAWKSVGRAPEATAALQSAFDLDPSTPDLARQLAVHEFQHGDPAEGVELIDDVLSGKAKQDVGLAFLAVESFQAHGRHQEALATLTRMQGAYPELAQDKDFLKYQKVSTKHQGSDKKITHGLIATGKGAIPAKDTHLRNRVAFILGPAIILLALAGYLFSAFRIGHGREVWLVNGTNEPIVATLNGQQIELAPFVPTTTRVEMGDVAITSKFAGSNAPAGPDATVRIFESFLARPFSNRVYVINPDMNAVLEVETTTYATTPTSLAGDGWVFHTGKPLHEFPSGEIRYVFVPFPNQTQLSGSKPQQFKRLGIVLDAEAEQTYALLHDNLGEGPANDRLVRMLATQPERTELYDLAQRALTPEAFVEAVQPGLAVRPLLVEAHRVYQDVKESQGEQAAMRLTYEKLLAQDPANPDLLYLVARTLDEPAAIEQLLARAASDPQRPSAMAHMALAYRRLVVGEFDAALASATRARALDGQHPEIRDIVSQALHATGKVQQMLDELETLTPSPFLRMSERAYLLARLGKKDEALASIASAMPQVPEEHRAFFQHTLESNVACTLGDDEAAAKIIDAGEVDPSGLTSALLRRDLTKIREGWATTKNEQRDLTTALQVAIAAHLLGDKALAEEARADAVKTLRSGVSHEASDLLRQACPPFDEVRGLMLDTAIKAPLLVVLGQQCPAIRGECFTLAKRLNYDRRFPASLIDEATNAR